MYKRLSVAIAAYQLTPGPSSELMNFNDRKLLIAFRMAQLISEQLDGGKGIEDDDVKDLEVAK